MSTAKEEEMRDSMTPRNLIRDLRRRKVFRVMAAYGVGAWLILQLVDLLSGAFPLPNGTVALTTIVLAMGFPIAAAISWAFQITPDGVVLDVADPTSRMKNRYRLIHFLDVIIICVLLVAVIYLSVGDRFSRNVADEIRIAVLPFENLSGDEEVTYLSEGIADDIRARLYEVPQLLLAARSSSASIFGKGLDIQTIGERLTVEHLLEGTIRKSDDRIRVTVQLVEVSTGLVNWVKTYNTRIDDVLEMQNNISLVVASQLEVLLSDDVRQVLTQNPTDDPIAYDYYLQAQEYLRRPRGMENVNLAATLFQSAIDQDSGFALGYAGLCDADIARYGMSSDSQYVGAAESNCALALELDSDLSEVHSVLGKLYMQLGRVSEAEQSFLQALALDPKSVIAFSGMGHVFVEQGKFIDAEARFRAAIEVQPGNWAGYNQLAFFLLSQRRYEEAIENYERLIGLSPDNAHGYNDLGAVYYMLGDFATAAEYWRKSLEIAPGRAAYSNTGSTYYYAGNYQEAAAMFEKASNEAKNDYRLWGNLADAQRFLEGGEQAAIDSYQKAIALALKKLSVAGNDSATLTNLAWYHVNIGDKPAAMQYLTSAQSLPNRDIQQIYTDALIYSLLGQANDVERTILDLKDRGFPQSILNETPELTNASR